MGISGHQWASVGMCGVSMDECGCGRVCVGVRRCVFVFPSVRWCAWVWVWAEGGGGHGDVHVWGMNFKNFFWRIESLNQRTLIRILYEFFNIYKQGL